MLMCLMRLMSLERSLWRWKVVLIGGWGVMQHFNGAIKCDMALVDLSA
jgi:hypothetical protein